MEEGREKEKILTHPDISPKAKPASKVVPSKLVVLGAQGEREKNRRDIEESLNAAR